MARKQSNELYYMDTGKAMLKICDNAFGIGKIVIRVVDHDSSQSEGSKVREEINFYLEPEKARYLAEFILGRIENGLKERALAEIQKQRAKGSKYCDPVYKSGIGTDCVKDERGNKIARATQFTIEPGMIKSPWVLKATVGTAVTTSTGGCGIDYKDKDHLKTIMVPLDETIAKAESNAYNANGALYAPNGIQVFAEALLNAVDELLIYRRLSTLYEKRNDN